MRVSWRGGEVFWDLESEPRFLQWTAGKSLWVCWLLISH